MPDIESISNWRHFARARVDCRVAYRDFKTIWETRSKDISFGGLRLIGYQPFQIGKPLGLSIVHPAATEPLLLHGRVAQVYSGRENAIGIAFDARSVSPARIERWVRHIVNADPTGTRVLTRMPSEIPISAILRREPFAPLERALTQSEETILARIDGPTPLSKLRREFGSDWERRAQAIFTLVAEGVVVPSLPEPGLRRENNNAVNSSALVGLKYMMNDLERQFGELDPRFAKDLLAMTRNAYSTDEDSNVPFHKQKTIVRPLPKRGPPPFKKKS